MTFSMNPSGLRIASDATATSPSSASREGKAGLSPCPSILIFLGSDPRSEFRADQLIAKAMLRARNQACRGFGQLSESKRRNLWNHRVPPEPWRWARVESEGWDKPLHR